MKSNPELCAKVAKQVFGGHLATDVFGSKVWNGLDEEFQIDEEDWAPDTDWGQFGMVVKEMAGQGWKVRIEPTVYHKRTAAAYQAAFFKDVWIGCGAAKSVDEIPKAACEAAVEALEGKQ
jgi:hypothetical protein